MKNHHYNYQLSTTIWLSSTIITMTEISSLLLHHKLLSIWSGRWFADRNDRSLTFDPFSCAYGSKPLNVYGNWTCETWGTTIVFSLTCFEKIARWLLLKMLYTYPICMPIVVPEKTQSPMIWFWLSPTPGIRARSHSPPNRDLTINNWWEDWPPKKWSCTNEEKNGHVWFCLLQWYI